VLHSRPPFRPLALSRKTTLPRVGNREWDRAIKLKKLTQLDNVANNTHDQETHSDGLRDAQELALVGYRGVHVSKLSLSHTLLVEKKGGFGGKYSVRLLHLVMNWRPSLTNSRGISRNSLAWSIAAGVCVGVCCVRCRFVCEVGNFLLLVWFRANWYGGLVVVVWCRMLQCCK
jgi:hypothetical protein